MKDFREAPFVARDLNIHYDYRIQMTRHGGHVKVKRRKPLRARRQAIRGKVHDVSVCVNGQ